MTVEQEVLPAYEAMMNAAWPQALDPSRRSMRARAERADRKARRESRFDEEREPREASAGFLTESARGRPYQQFAEGLARVTRTNHFEYHPARGELGNP